MAPHNTLLQNATGIITKWTAILLQMLQKFITKCVRFFTSKYDRLITNCESTLMLLVHKKTYQEIIKIKLQNFLFK